MIAESRRLRKSPRELSAVSAARRHRAARGPASRGSSAALSGQGRPVDLALVVQPAKELLEGPLARRGGRWGGALKFGRDEGLHVLAVDAARGGGHALAGQERHQECPVVV